MSDPESTPPSVRWARLRLAVVAPLLASPPEHGALQERITELAAQKWKHPSTGEPVSFDFKTIERWYYVARAAGLPAQARARRLDRRRRRDAMNQSSNVLHGIKFTPFRPDVPIEALHTTPAIDFFVRRVELGIADGGFVSVTGEPGSGKSFARRLLADRLRRLPNVVVGMIEHPQSRTSDFYRELGDLFGIPLQVHNRWAGFKALRQRWSEHIAQTLMRPVLIIDEAQEAQTAVLNEIRILASKELDSRHAVILFEHPTIDEHHLDDPPSLVAARRVLGASRALRRELRRYHVAVLDALGSPDDELPF